MILEGASCHGVLIPTCVLIIIVYFYDNLCYNGNDMKLVILDVAAF